MSESYLVNPCTNIRLILPNEEYFLVIVLEGRPICKFCFNLINSTCQLILINQNR